MKHVYYLLLGVLAIGILFILTPLLIFVVPIGALYCLGKEFAEYTTFKHKK